MAARHPLQDINDFPSLVEFLRDELDWPIESESFDDLTFDFAFYSICVSTTQSQQQR